MNMNHSTMSDLRVLLASRPDLGGGHHRCVVYPNGDVKIIDSQGPVDPLGAKFWLTTLSRGNDYVGPNAALDDVWVKRLLKCLTQLWSTDFNGQCERIP